MQLTAYIFMITKNYKIASENNVENYYFYINNKKKKSNSNLKRIDQNLSDFEINNSENKVNNTFSPLKEEISFTTENKEENNDISESNKNYRVGNGKQIEFKDSLNKNQTNNLENINIKNELMLMKYILLEL